MPEPVTATISAKGIANANASATIGVVAVYEPPILMPIGAAQQLGIAFPIVATSTLLMPIGSTSQTGLSFPVVATTTLAMQIAQATQSTFSLPMLEG